MKILTMEEIHSYLLTSLIDFDAYCRSHDIKYSLCGGTLIGAARHQGFVPWDDDTDVMMTRSEYDKLTQCWIEDPNPNYTLLTDGTENLVQAGRCGKWYANNTAPRYPKNEFDIGIFLDLFVADGLPHDKEQAKKYFTQVHHKGHDYYISYKHRNHPFFKFLYVMYPPYRPSAILKNIKKKLKKYPDTEAKYLAFIFGSSKDFDRELIPKQYFDSFTTLYFEGHEFPVISKYDAYLRHYYGNYMEFPPEEERVPEHDGNHTIRD